MTSLPLSPRRSARRRVVLLVLGATAAAALWVVLSRPSGPTDLDRGWTALEADDPAAARPLLEGFLAAHPTHAKAHFGAARAARKLGDLAAARQHLDEAERLGWDESAVAFERALGRAQGGDAAAVESVLWQRIDAAAPDAAEAFPVLIDVYAGQFRWTEAERLASRWVEMRPDSARAWARRGDILERLRRRTESIDARREAVRLDPDDAKTRLALVRLLLEVRQPPAEVAAHIEWLMRRAPDDPATLSLAAACRLAEGRATEAAALLDRVIAKGTADAAAYHLRGKIDLDRGQATAAVPFLRRAAELGPSDPQILYSLFQSLERAGYREEAHKAEARWAQAEADLRRAGELAKAISANPRDRALRREMGELFLRNAREADGVRWLESVLDIDPADAAAHRILAEYFERTGRPERAAGHRAAVGSLGTDVHGPEK